VSSSQKAGVFPSVFSPGRDCGYLFRVAPACLPVCACLTACVSAVSHRFFFLLSFSDLLLGTVLIQFLISCRYTGTHTHTDIITASLNQFCFFFSHFSVFGFTQLFQKPTEQSKDPFLFSFPLKKKFSL
jgi:hypothetical protein